MKSHGVLSRYIVKEFVLAFLVTFSFFFFIFFVNVLLVMAEQIFSRRVPAREVALLLIYSIPQVLSISIPFAALVGSLMAVGRLSADNEILAIQASGVALSVVMRVVIALGLFFSLLAFFANDYLLPAGNIRLGRVYRRIISNNPGIELEPYSIKRHGNTVIITGDVTGNVISDFTIIDRTEDKKRRVIFSPRAELVAGSERDVVSFRLERALLQVRDMKKPEEFEYSTAETMLYNMPLKQIRPSMQNPGPREMRSVDVWAVIAAKRVKLAERIDAAEAQRERLLLNLVTEIAYMQELRADSPQQAEKRGEVIARAYRSLEAQRRKRIYDRSLRRYTFEFHKKISMSVAALCFFLFALPTGLLTHRSGRMVGFGVGLLVSILYWALLVAGETLAPKLIVPPAVAAWLPDAALLVMAGLLSLVLVRSR